MFFAQQGGQFGRPPAGGGGGGEEFIGLGVMCAYFVFLLLMLAIVIWFYMTLSTALSRCSPRNRTMEPGMVWLNLIPLFGIVWIFFTVIRVCESIRNEFHSRRWRDDGDFGQSMGITGVVLGLVGCGLIGMIFIIIYWVKIAGYSAQLKTGGPPSSRQRDDDYDDYDDDRDERPRRRRDRDDDDDERYSR